jgi:hypothetical protein
MKPGEKENLYPLTVGACLACGLVQLDSAPPAEQLRPVFDWVKYVEPEAHLDKLADLVAKRLEPGSKVLGVTYKDDSFLERLKKRGAGETRRLDPARDLGIEDPCAGLETIQARLAEGRAEGLRGWADLVVARHVAEHAFDTRRFLSSLRALAGPRGLLMVEVPDSEGAFRSGDVSALWEEHLVYFTDATLGETARRAGLSAVTSLRYPYTLEDCLVLLAKPGADEVTASAAPPARLEQARRFAAGVQSRRRSIRQRLTAAKSGGPIAFFGAGHRGCLYINAFGLKEFLSFVVDDSPDKRGLEMPGSRLPIRGSDALVREGAKLCLLGVNPDSEKKIIAARRDFVEAGGAFLSTHAA